MCEQTEIDYLDGEVVWVKLGACWWPGEVVAPEKLPPDLLPSFRKPPIAVVKFFKENTYEYVKNINSIYKYNCSRKKEFINKGLYMYRTKHGPMEKFPEDVIRAETATGGDIEILTRDEYQEMKKESYAGLFGEPTKKTPGSIKKGKGKGRPMESPKISTPIRKIYKEKSDYKVHILVQGSKQPQSPDTASEPSTSQTDPESSEDKSQSVTETPKKVDRPASTFTTPVSNSGIYSCHAHSCPFTTSRLNVMILHNKTHSVTYSPYIPTPVRKKPQKPSPKSSSKTPKQSRPRKEKPEKVKKTVQKRVSDKLPSHTEVKKIKTDEEIKSSLLADWDDVDEDSNDESSTMIMAGSPEVPVAAESPAVPTPSELPSAQVPGEMSTLPEKKENDTFNTEKPESSSDSKYEFCEDEDWPEEADAGRKIPRVKNPSKRKEDTKSLSLDDDEVAREVAELLNKTSVPELPSIPEPLKVEENFPEPSVVKSPDKISNKSPELNKLPEKSTTETQPTKAIFKTKTFFRSRHSRSQDAIGKYVAEQLNAVERMDTSECDINGSEVVSSPETRESPPVEHVKVARLAPKIQLKKMKAEAAQMREKEKINAQQADDTFLKSRAQCENIVQDQGPDKEISNINENETFNTSQDIFDQSKEIKSIDNELSQEELSKDVKSSENETFEPINQVNNEIDNINDHISHEKIDEIEHPPAIIKFPEANIQKGFEQSMEPYMNESTASAVDALLSVSRDTDRVTKVISNGPPEDLFEDDVKDSGLINNINGHHGQINENIINEKDKRDDEIEAMKIDPLKSDFHEVNNEVIDTATHDDVDHNALSKDDLKHDNVEPKINLESETNISLTPETNTESNINIESVNDDTPEINITSEIDSRSENVPSESDLQIAETLINLPATTIQKNSPSELQEISNEPNLVDCEQFQEETVHTTEDVPLNNVKTSNLNEVNVSLNPEVVTKSHNLPNKENVNIRFETEHEQSENLNAAKSLVQMSESIDHKINIIENNSQQNIKDVSSPKNLNTNENKTIDVNCSVEQQVASLSSENSSNVVNNEKIIKFETTSSKLLKILEEPYAPRVSTNKTTPTKQIVPGKEKILNFDVDKSSPKSKPELPNQKIIIRRAGPNKTLINNLTEVTTADKIILSRNNKPTPDGSSVQTYSIQASPEVTSDQNTIIIQQKLRKVPKPPPKLQIKPQPSLITPMKDIKTVSDNPSTEDAMFDINSMPVVLSDDILTPENIEKMPIVMSDGNIISNPPNPPKIVKTKQTIIEKEKVMITSTTNKPDVKTLLMNPVNELNKVTTPNILSKSSKIRGAKPMLVIDKTTGKQKIIMTKAEPNVKEIKQTPTKIQAVPQPAGKTEEFILLPAGSSSRPGRSQKIVIDPQTRKAHVLVAKGPETTLNVAESKPVSAKLIPSVSDISTPGNTVMIITNAQGTQSRIVLTPEHEKILFPNKQQQNLSQLKTIPHRITTNTANMQKNIVTTTSSPKTQTRIVPKQKNVIITSKGQLIVGCRIASTTQNIAPMPEIRPVQKRIVAAEPKKIVQNIQKNTSEPLIFLQQKSGAVMQLTAAQFEHLQRTGQIVQKTPTPVQENKIVVQKPIALSSNEPIAPNIVHKQKGKRPAPASPTPAKKVRQEIAIAPAPAPPPAPLSVAPMPAVAPVVNTVATTLVPSASNTVSVTTTSTYPDLENFEELLPSTAIVRPSEPQPVVAQPETAPASAPPPAQLSDGQLLAVAGEHFGGPQGSFYLCVEENGTLTPIDNRPLVLENNQLVPMAVEPLPALAHQPERRDILEAALANSDVFHAEAPRDEAPDFRDLNANVSVHCRVSETSTTLNQPIMTPVEVPTKADSEPTVPSNLEDGLAVIGVTPQTVPTSLELPITVTDPRIAPKTTDPLCNTTYATTLLASPGADLHYATAEGPETATEGPISMPLLTEEEAVGKSMPILTDDVTERTASSLESAAGSPSSAEVRESEPEEGAPWTRRLLTPLSDTSDTSATSAEIPLQPAIQLSVNYLSRNS